MHHHHTLTLLALATLAPTGAIAQTCAATAAAQAPLVVELYTSEGCSSCPPADRWLSTLKGRSDVLPMAFHVGYWDHLGWPDRFARQAYTERQYSWAALHRSRQVYTPQTVVNGVDWRQWPRLPTQRSDAPVTLRLQRQGDQVLAVVGATAATAAMPPLAGYWAVLENGHSSKVRAGENSGETLKHDHVVRLLQPVPSWPASAGLQSELTVTPGQPEFPRRVVFVVTDATSQRPVQALALDC